MGADATTEVLELYQKWTRAWRTIDPELMLSLYDLDSDDLAYQSEENVGPLYTAAELRSYWGAARGMLEEIPIWQEKSKKIIVSGDHAFITVWLDTKIIAPAFGGAIEGEVRATLGCRKRGGRWYIVQYHESRQLELAKEAGVTYVGAQAS
jgi:uncharacterized protein (TIGR02246 family)